MYPFQKPLKLPSNGLSYSAIVKVKPLTNAFIYAIEDSMFLNNFTETKAIAMAPFLDISPYEMYYADLIFLWNYFIIMTFKKTEITKNEVCKHCKTENDILIPLDSLDVVYLKEKKETLEFEYSYNGKPMVIHYRRRKVVDNIETAFDNIELQNALTDIESYITYFANLLYHQIVKIDYENKSMTAITKDLLMDLFNFVDDKNDFMTKLYEAFLEYTDFGILNTIGFFCKECGEKNKIKFFDALTDSFYMQSISDSGKQTVGYLEFVREGFLSFEELMNLPITLNEQFFNRCVEILDKQRDSGGIDYRKFHGLA